jgi:GTP-binding protein
MDVNPAKEKKLSNVRSATGDELVRLAPPRAMSLDQALEFIREDEAVEVTPNAVRLRKVELEHTLRSRQAKRAKHGGAPS